jgi:hypothetical protein
MEHLEPRIKLIEARLPDSAANSIPEFDVGLDHKRQLQPAELFKHPFSAELMGAGFDKSANPRYFALRFPRLLKIHGIRSFNHQSNTSKKPLRILYSDFQSFKIVQIPPRYKCPPSPCLPERIKPEFAPPFPEFCISFQLLLSSKNPSNTSRPRIASKSLLSDNSCC